MSAIPNQHVHVRSRLCVFLALVTPVVSETVERKRREYHSVFISHLSINSFNEAVNFPSARPDN